MLNNINITKLSRINLEGGNVNHVLKKSESDFSSFGEGYVSFIKYNHIKGWKKHNKMTMNLVVPIGNVKFVFYDNQKLVFKEEIIGEDNYCRLTVPPKIWFAFKGVSKEINLIINISNIEHDPNEQEKLDLELIKYSW
tara:strand:+ start:327 stop:740 length:414 start_codon:yes stop_codon:yes gene_type:complete